MKKKHDINDKFLGDLSKKAIQEKPPKNFTDNIMAKISTLPQIESFSSQPILSKRMWFLIIAAFAVLVTFVFFMDLSGIASFFENISIRNTQMATLFESIILSFKQIFASIHISSISIIIGVSIVLLFVVDRLLKRPKKQGL